MHAPYNHIVGGNNYYLAVGNTVCDVIDNNDSLIATIEIPDPGECCTPLAALHEEHQVLVVCNNSTGDLHAYSLADGEKLWQERVPPVVSALFVLPFTNLLLVSGEESCVLEISSGELVESPLGDFHSHIPTGRGCVAVKNRTGEKMCYRSDRDEYVHLPTVSGRPRFAAVTENGVMALDLAGKDSEIYVCLLSAAGSWRTIDFEGCTFVAAVGLAASEDAILVLCNKGMGKGIDLWRIDGRAAVKKGVELDLKGAGWQFHNTGRRLISPLGGSFDLRPYI